MISSMCAQAGKPGADLPKMDSAASLGGAMGVFMDATAD
jgi:hypothetical protein